MNVAIVGAGIGGLTLAAALRRRAPGLAVQIHEADEGPFARRQGYALGLRQESGLGVLEALGLRAAVLSSDAVRVGNFAFTDERGREILALPAGADERRAVYRVQRRHLRQVLLRAIEGVPIHFGRRCTGYRRARSQVVLEFADGTRAAADLAVGCDGVRSVLRAQMAPSPARYLGLTGIYGDAPILPDHPLLAGGYFISLGRDGSSFFCYPQPGRTTHFSYTYRAAAPPAPATEEDRPRLLDRVREGTRGWHDLVVEIVRATLVESVGLRGYHDRPPPTSVTDGKAWLMGDAAHAMCPFQGQGANMAMLDALDLAGVVGGQEDRARVDRRIVGRGRAAVLTSRRSAARLHTASRIQQVSRDVAFRIANAFLHLPFFGGTGLHSSRSRRSTTFL